MTITFTPANVTFVRRGLERKVAYVEVAPAPALANDVDYFWGMGLSEPLQSPWVTASPGKGSVDLIIPIDGHFCQNAERHLFGTSPAGAYLVGPLSQPARIVSTGRCTAIGVRFRPGRSRSFFRFPTHEIRNICLSIDAVDKKLARVADEVVGFGSFVARIRVLAEALLASRTTESEDLLVRRAVDVIDAHHGLLSVDIVAEMLHTSLRHLERSFRDSVGVSPKQLSRMVRVRRAASLVCHARMRFTDVAQTCGYFDQAHFIREFKAVTGIVPSEFARQQHPCAGAQ